VPAARAICSSVALTAFLAGLACLPLPLAGSAVFLLPSPLLRLAGVWGVHAAALSAALSSLVIAPLLGADAAIVYLVLAAIPAVLAVHLLRGGAGLEWVVATGALVSAGVTLTLAWVSYGSWGPLLSDLSRSFDTSFERWTALQRSLGASEDFLRELQTLRPEMVETVLSLVPALLIITCAVVWFANFWLASRRCAWPQMLDLTRWEISPWLIWGLIASGFGLFVSVEPIVTVARNVFAVMLAFYFCQGLAIVHYYLVRLGLPRPLRVASYLLIAFQQIVAAAVLALGVFDLWGDFRRLRPVSGEIDAGIE